MKKSSVLFIILFLLQYTSFAQGGWFRQNPPQLRSGFFFNEIAGAGSGDGVTILSTTNGGVTFVEEDQINEVPTGSDFRKTIPIHSIPAQQ